jgi:CPA2 family monovalent cation:H+ antiporter-2
MNAVYGDASQAETLRAVGLARCGTLILSSAGMQATEEVIRIAREQNPSILILARAVYASQLKGLRQAGADEVFSGEGEVALAFAEKILDTLGATPEQIARERQRVAADLLGRIPADT